MGLSDLFGGGGDKVSKFARFGGMAGPLFGGLGNQMFGPQMGSMMQGLAPSFGAMAGGGNMKQAANAGIGYHPGVSAFNALSGKPTGAGLFGGDPMQASLGQNIGKLGMMTGAVLGGVGAAPMMGAAPAAPMMSGSGMAMRGAQMTPQLMQLLSQLMNQQQQRRY